MKKLLFVIMVFTLSYTSTATWKVTIDNPVSGTIYQNGGVYTDKFHTFVHWNMQTENLWRAKLLCKNDDVNNSTFQEIATGLIDHYTNDFDHGHYTLRVDLYYVNELTGALTLKAQSDPVSVNFVRRYWMRLGGIPDGAKIQVDVNDNVTLPGGKYLAPGNHIFSAVEEIGPAGLIMRFERWTTYRMDTYYSSTLNYQTGDGNGDILNIYYNYQPAVPTNFIYSISSGHPYFTWGACQGAATYEIERRIISYYDWTVIGTVTGTNYTDNDLTVIQGYPYTAEYRVRAKSVKGLYSDYSSTLSIQGKLKGLFKDGRIGEAIPSEFSMNQNYPNPFNPSTMISFSIPLDASVSLKVYDMSGREVASLVDGFRSAGSYNVSFDASKLASGIYIYKIQAGEFSAVKKMQVLK